MQPPGQRLSIETFQPDLLSDTISGAGFEHRLLCGGAFVGQLDRVHLPNCRLDRGCYSLPCFTRGAFPEGWMVVGFTYCPHERGWANGSELRHDSIQVYSEGHALDYRTAPNAPWYAIQVRRDWLQEQSIQLLGRELQLPVRRSCNLNVPHSAVLSLRAEMDCIFTEDAHRHALQLDQAAVSAERRLITLMVAVIATSNSRHLAESLMTQRKRHFVRRMERFLSERLSEPYCIREMIEEIGFTERTLQRFCKDVYGLTPTEVFGVARLNRIRKELLCREYKMSTIRQIATEWGITHQGRFAAHYRRLFNERPGETLSRLK